MNVISEENRREANEKVDKTKREIQHIYLIFSLKIKIIIEFYNFQPEVLI